ncbi:MAG: hypothetical protein J07HX64_02045 [halophilic archaeon J07HX64]|jgi:hypothetical protein|nr:MAG: hypothetical protein J07HX64_02045 [halophilic archaeon J07HX64]
MLGNIDRERAEAVFALVFVSVAVGTGIGLSAAGTDSLPVSVEVLGLAGFTVIIPVVMLVGQLTERLLATGTVPGLDIKIDAPDNATTGFYAAGAVLMTLGLVVELVTGRVDPLVVLLYLACGTLALSRGFRRGTGATTGS